MLNAWDAARNFLAAQKPKNLQGIEIAATLGWTEIRRDPDDKYREHMNHTARAYRPLCHSSRSAFDRMASRCG
jgi:hypothetical protein